MEWIQLNSVEAVEAIKADNGYSIIFKHSTRCSVSMFAKRSFESDWEAIPPSTKIYFLDLIAHRDISNFVAELFQVHHESPQTLLIHNGQCVLDQSHSDISAEELAETIKN